MAEYSYSYLLPSTFFTGATIGLLEVLSAITGLSLDTLSAGKTEGASLLLKPGSDFLHDFAPNTMPITSASIKTNATAAIIIKRTLLFLTAATDSPFPPEDLAGFCLRGFSVFSDLVIAAGFAFSDFDAPKGASTAAAAAGLFTCAAGFSVFCAATVLPAGLVAAAAGLAAGLGSAAGFALSAGLVAAAGFAVAAGFAAAVAVLVTGLGAVAGLLSAGLTVAAGLAAGFATGFTVAAGFAAGAVLVTGLTVAAGFAVEVVLVTGFTVAAGLASVFGLLSFSAIKYLLV